MSINIQKTGWIGLGTMGHPMVLNLLEKGCAVTVYNRTQSKAQNLLDAGAIWAATPKEIWHTADVVAIMVSDDTASEAVIAGPDGLLTGENINGKIIINSSTISPEMARQLAAQTTVKGAIYLDAPVSGSAWAAKDASLLFLVGGDKTAFKAIEPLLDKMGKKNFYLGEVSSGNKAKLAINYLIAINYLGLAETVLFAEKMGIDKALMLDIINNSGAGNVTTKAKTTPIVQDDFSTVAFELKHMFKDVGLAAKEGNDYPLMTKGLFAAYKEALDAGYGEKDVMEIIRYVKSKYSHP